MRAKGTDFDAILEFLEDIYDVDALPDLPRRAMSGLAKLVPAEVMSYNEIGVRQRHVLMFEQPAGSIGPSDKATFARLAPQHPLITHYARTQDPAPRKISDFLSQRQFRALELYQDFFRRVGIDYQLAVTIPSPDPVIGIALNRSRRDFSERDRSMLGTIRPLLAQAYRSLQVRTSLREMLAALQHAAEGSGLACLLINTTRHIAFATPLAEKLMAGYFGQRLPEGNLLPRAIEGWVRHQSAGPMNDVSTLAAPLTVSGENGQLRIDFLPHGETGGYDALVLRETRRAARAAASLTRREREVLSLVSSGKTNPEIADALSVTRSTVQKHLENIYDKLGVRSRTAAAVLMVAASGS